MKRNRTCGMCPWGHGPAERQVRFARRGRPTSPERGKLGDNGVLVGRDPTRFAVASSLDEKGLGESAFRLGFAET